MNLIGPEWSRPAPIGRQQAELGQDHGRQLPESGALLPT
jgi:hypothetical protein